MWITWCLHTQHGADPVRRVRDPLNAVSQGRRTRATAGAWSGSILGIPWSREEKKKNKRHHTVSVYTMQYVFFFVFSLFELCSQLKGKMRYITAPR